MPAGTVKVDVSDVYDWYKLGQHISNMKGLGQHDFGQGPPSAILSFGSEDLEHQYIQALKKTGLTTTDIDPVDPNQPPGMPRQKTDPTYNVDENFAELGEEDLDEDWKSALAGAAAAGAMAFTPAPTNVTATPTAGAAQPAAVQQTPGAAAEGALSRIAQAAGIKGVELAQFLAQCAHETGDFAHLEELGGKNYLAKYDPTVNPAKARALGNTQAGDGAKYKGRGFIQITGKANYANASKALGIDLVNNPEAAARPDVAAKIAVWYWQNRVAPYVQDFSDTRGVTKRINPGLQGLQDRQSNFKDYQQQVATVAQPGPAV
jgi:putative chitinase